MLRAVRIIGVALTVLIMLGLVFRLADAWAEGRLFLGQNVYHLPIGTYSTALVIVLAVGIGLLALWRRVRKPHQASGVGGERPPPFRDYSDVVVVNESHDPALRGDVSLFRTAAEACNYLEPWWVESGEGMVLALSGQEILLGVSDGRVVVTDRHPTASGRDRVRSWLIDTARSLPGDQPIPDKVEDLVELIGFTR